MNRDESQIYFSFRKADAKRREVVGRATAEVPDRDNEMYDFDSSLPYMQAWSSSTYSASGGQSYGNLRYMHQPRVCGKLVDITFDADQKAVDVVAKITDEDVWNDIEQGVLCGFSLGGRYVAKWDDSFGGKPIKRFTAAPSELSIVDRPSCPASEFFELRKRDGDRTHVRCQNSYTDRGLSNMHTPDPGPDTQGFHKMADVLHGIHARGPGNEVARNQGDLSKDVSVSPHAAERAADLRKGSASSGLAVRASAGRGVSKDEINRLGASGITVEDVSLDANGIGRNSLDVFKKTLAPNNLKKGNPLTDDDDDKPSVDEALDKPSPKKKRRIAAVKRKRLAEVTAKTVGASKRMNERQIALLAKEIEAELAKMSGDDDDDDDDAPSQRVTQASPSQASYMSNPRALPTDDDAPQAGETFENWRKRQSPKPFSPGTF